MIPILYFFHLLSIVIWIGSIIFFSFVSAPAIFKALPRETAGDVVAQIFPKYYRTGAICGATALITLLVLSHETESHPTFRLIALGIMTLITFYSSLFVGPKVRQLKAELRQAKDGPEKAIKQAAFSRLHGLSMGLNMLVLAIGLLFLFMTALTLHH